MHILSLFPLNQNMAPIFSSAKVIVGKIIKMACVDKRKLYYSVRVSITIIIVAVTYWRVRVVQLGGFGNSVVCAAATVLPTTELHVGETLNKAIINIVANIVGVLLGYGLRRFSEYEIGKAKLAFLLPAIFTLIVLGILVRFVKAMKDRYDCGLTAFLLAMLVGALPLFGSDWITKEFCKNTATLGIAYALIILSSFLPPFWAGVDVHYRVQDYLHALNAIFKGLDEECFRENCMNENLQDKSFLQSLQSLIDSKEKESSLIKFVSWELPWRHLQKQYEKIGDLSRSCACTIYSLSTYLATKYSTDHENLHFSPQLRETCKEMCSESAKALEQLSLSMKHKTAPAASTYVHVKAALSFESHLENTIEAKDITFHLVESVMIIEKLSSSIEELAGLVPFKRFEKDSNVPELLTGLGSSQRFILVIQKEVTTRTNQLVTLLKKLVSELFAYYKKFKFKLSSVPDGPDTTQPHVNLIPISNSELQTEEHKLGQVAIDIDPPARPV